MAKLIYLSPSNHGKNQNRCLKADCFEDKHTRPIAEVCARYLKNSGFEVVVGKPSQNMAARCQEADKKGAELYVPVHTLMLRQKRRDICFLCFIMTMRYTESCSMQCLRILRKCIREIKRQFFRSEQRCMR